MNFFRFASLLLLMSLVLSGCNLLAIRKQAPRIAVKDPRDLTHWEFKGRVALRTSKESNILRIHWRQHQQNIALRIYGSFGKTYARLDRVNGLSTLHVENKTYQDNNAEILLWRVLGWQIPINEMSFWIRGIPANSDFSPTISRNKSGYLKTLNYNNWQVQYEKYKIFSAYPLPIKLKLTHPDLSLKFSIQNWIIYPQ